MEGSEVGGRCSVLGLKDQGRSKSSSPSGRWQIALLDRRRCEAVASARADPNWDLLRSLV